MSEKQIQSQILKYLKKHYPNAIAWKLHEDPVFGVVGIPDILFVVDGVAFFFEVKKPGECASKIQKSVLKKLKNNDIIAEVVYSVADVQHYLAQGGINACN